MIISIVIKISLIYNYFFIVIFFVYIFNEDDNVKLKCLITEKKLIES